MRKLVEYIQHSYYLNLITPAVALAGYLLLRKKNQAGLKIFSLYLLLYVLEHLFYFLGIGLFFNTRKYAEVTSFLYLEDFCFTVFEFYIFYVYIKRAVNNFYPDKIFQAIACTFFGIAFFILCKELLGPGRVTTEANQQCFLIQAILLLSLSVSYYIKVFNSPPVFNLFNEPPFWVITGLSFFMLCTLPFSFCINHIMHADYKLYAHLFSIYYIFYILLFLMIIRASLCKPLVSQ